MQLPRPLAIFTSAPRGLGAAMKVLAVLDRPDFDTHRVADLRDS